MQNRTGTPIEVLEAFVLRARRILEHSLIRDHRELMTQVFSGEQTVLVTENTKTGEVGYELKMEFPAEELMESLAARIRPLLLGKELVSYKKVLTAIERAVPAERLAEYSEPIQWWREHWRERVEKSQHAQAYQVVTATGVVSDRELMHAWLYGDLVHADDIERSTLGLSIDERYRAAAGVVSRIGECVERTYELVRLLVDEGLLDLSPAVFDKPVTVKDPNLLKKVEAYVAPVGTPIPDELGDLGDEWRPANEVLRPTEPIGS